MFNIIIPYSHPIEKFSLLFSSLLAQQNVDFEIILIDYNNECLSMPEEFQKLKHQIVTLDCPIKTHYGIFSQGLKYCKFSYTLYLTEYTTLATENSLFELKTQITTYHPDYIFFNQSLIVNKNNDVNIIKTNPAHLSNYCYSTLFLLKYNLNTVKNELLFLETLQTSSSFACAYDSSIIAYILEYNIFFWLQEIQELINFYTTQPNYYPSLIKLNNLDGLELHLFNLFNYSLGCEEFDCCINYFYTCLQRYFPIQLQDKPTELLDITRKIYNTAEMQENKIKCIDYLQLILSADFNYKQLFDQAENLYIKNLPEKKYENQRICTVIIPTYNNSEEHYLRLFQTINNQTLVDFITVLIIDDGSTLNILTQDFIQKNLQADFILHRREENRGIGYSRQEGIELTKTKYYVMMDSDDTLGVDKTLEYYMDYMEANPDIPLCCGWESHFIYDEEIEDYHGFGLHGYCGRKDELIKHIKFLPIQYCEDRIYSEELNILSLPQIILPFVSYNRYEGHLTHNIPTILNYFNDLNDTYCYVSRFANRKNTVNLPDNQFTIQKMACVINVLATLFWMLSDVPEENRTEWSAAHAKLPPRSMIPDEIKRSLPVYYFIKIFQTCPHDVLEAIVKHPTWLINAAYDNCQLIRVYLLDYLLGNDSWYIDKEILSFQEIEDRYKNYINTLVTSLKDSGYEIKPQLLKHYPWCYNSDIFKGDF